MYQFPLIEAERELGEEEIVGEMLKTWFRAGSKPEIRKISETIRHQLSHQLIMARFIHVSVSGADSCPQGDGLISIPAGHLDGYAFPRLIGSYLGQNSNAFAAADGG